MKFCAAALTTALLMASCSASKEPAASPVSTTAPATTSTTTTTTTSTTSTTTTTTTTTTAPLPDPSPQVMAVVDALSTGWEKQPLGRTGYGAPQRILTLADTQIVATSSYAGACCTSIELYIGSVGEPLSLIDDAAKFFPSLNGYNTAGFTSGINDAVFTDDGILLVGNWLDPAAGLEPNSGPFPVPWAAHSTDGAHWTFHAGPGFGGFRSVVRADGRYLATLGDIGLRNRTDNVPEGKRALMSSPDGAEWTLEREFDGDDDSQPFVSQVGDIVLLDFGSSLETSRDGGHSWEPASDEWRAEQLTFFDAGVLRVRDASTSWTSDGVTWTDVGIGSADLGLVSDWRRNIIAVGDVLISTDGGGFWVTDTTSPWTPVPRPDAFGFVNDESPWITGLSVADNGTILAVGATTADEQFNKPTSDYVTWSHPTLEPVLGLVPNLAREPLTVDGFASLATGETANELAARDIELTNADCGVSYGRQMIFSFSPEGLIDLIRVGEPEAIQERHLCA